MKRISAAGAFFVASVILAVGAFFWRYEPVPIQWKPVSSGLADHFVVYYGEESRHPWWDDLEENYYYLEQSGDIAERAKQMLERIPSDDPRRIEIEAFLKKAEKNEEEIAQIFAQITPYERVKIVSGEKTGTVLWLRRGVRHYAAIRFFNSEGQGSNFSEEWIHLPDGDPELHSVPMQRAVPINTI